MEKSEKTRVLIVVFDALRPEFMTPALMPNLHGFAEKGVHFTNSRSTFPTETRVNQSAIVTGCYPSRHGIVANRFPEPDGAPGEVLDSGDDFKLEAALRRLEGRLFGVPTLGEYLAAAGLRYATLSAGTAGGGRLINHCAESVGGFRLAMRRPEATVPIGELEKITSRIGPLPEFSRPAISWISWAVNCYLSYVEPDIAPDVMLLWLCEPDESCHYLGIGAEGTLAAIRHSDAEFGRILDHRAHEIDTGRLQVVALSDHGQISLVGERLDVIAKFKEAGIRAAAIPEGDEDCVAVIGNGGGLWVRHSDPALVGKIVEWLRGQEWCGPLFTRNGDSGTLAQDLIGVRHRRAPDIGIILQYSDNMNAWGLEGTTFHDSRYPAGGGCHGGLSSYELHTVLAMSGGMFKEKQTISQPAGNIDIAPTVMALLGLNVPENLDGRVLNEAFAGGSHRAEAAELRERTYSSTDSSGPTTHLSVSETGRSRYLNRAWIT